jgi:hypothetical protein
MLREGSINIYIGKQFALAGDSLLGTKTILLLFSTKRWNIIPFFLLYHSKIKSFFFFLFPFFCSTYTPSRRKISLCIGDGGVILDKFFKKSIIQKFVAIGYNETKLINWWFQLCSEFFQYSPCRIYLIIEFRKTRTNFGIKNIRGWTIWV